MGCLVVVGLVVLAVAELFVFVQLASDFGFFPTLLAALLFIVLGLWLTVHEGRTVWRRFNESVRQRRAPTKEVADGVLLLIAGALLVFPGFLTDLAGVLLLLPPVRALLRPALVRGAERGLGVRNVRVVTATYDRGRPDVQEAHGEDITGRELEPPPGDGPPST